MATPIDQQAGTLRVLNDHAELAGPVQVALETENIHEARAASDEIVELISGHMIVEEGPGGVFDALAGAEPRLAASLDRLRDDHRRLRQLMSDIQRLRGEPGELRRIKMFAALLEVHETREQAALEAARRAQLPS